MQALFPWKKEYWLKWTWTYSKESGTTEGTKLSSVYEGRNPFEVPQNLCLDKGFSGEPAVYSTLKTALVHKDSTNHPRKKLHLNRPYADCSIASCSKSPSTAPCGRTGRNSHKCNSGKQRNNCFLHSKISKNLCYNVAFPLLNRYLCVYYISHGIFFRNM